MLSKLLSRWADKLAAKRIDDLTKSRNAVLGDRAELERSLSEARDSIRIMSADMAQAVKDAEDAERDAERARRKAAAAKSELIRTRAEIEIASDRCDMLTEQNAAYRETCESLKWVSFSRSAEAEAFASLFRDGHAANVGNRAAEQIAKG